MMKPALIIPLALGLAACATSEERRQIQKPIADTYAPLEGAPVNHRYSQELDELRAWQDAKRQSEADYQPEPGTLTETPQIPAERIQEPQPSAGKQAASDPDIEEDDNSLRIRD